MGKRLRSQFSILAQSGLAQFANILWSQFGDTLPGRIIGLLSFSLQRHIWPRGQFYNTNQNISRKQIWFLSNPSPIIVWPCRSVTLSDTEGSSYVKSNPCIWALPFLGGIYLLMNHQVEIGLVLQENVEIGPQKSALEFPFKRGTKRCQVGHLTWRNEYLKSHCIVQC